MRTMRQGCAGDGGPRLAHSAFMPSLPPRNVTSNYTVSLLRAPYKALEDSTAEEDVKVLHNRPRKQAGSTNRWQLASVLGGDLLGRAQASRAVRAVLNSSLRAIRTADSPFGVSEEGVCSGTPASCHPPPQRRSSPPGHRRSVRLPGSPRPATPEDLFYLLSQRVAHPSSPDAVLECLGSYWELHCPYLSQSGTLTELYSAARRHRAETLSRTGGQGTSGRDMGGSLGDTAHLLQDRHKETPPTPLILRLCVRDPAVSREALSVALRSLYTPEPELTLRGLEGVLSAATLLDLPPLYQRCLSVMESHIGPSTVSRFHSLASKYREATLLQACERWLELHLVSELQSHVRLRELPRELLHKTLRSPRLFTPNEYQLFRTVLYWVFLQLNPTVPVLPSHSSILTFFISLPRTGVFLAQDLGQKFTSLFQCLRLHGITERAHLEEIQQIDVLPQSSLLLLFSRHYYALHSGGDMPLTDFSQQAVRFGLTIERDPQCRALTASLYGFYFLLKAARLGDTDTHGFSIQRLRQCDPALSLRACESHPYSLRAERGVRYQISVQGQVGGQWREFCTGPLSKEFGVTQRSCKSQVFKVQGLGLPVFVTFALVFPAF
ncbi:BTB/POZ domain-containing protein 16 [Amia ocellicauda]|uniref:BTB/POZ domain-containing protein 16 n=1 Tax=Amia ocellicauda TaxID=2972642 RepID=UPI0034645AD7